MLTSFAHPAWIDSDEKAVNIRTHDAGTVQGRLGLRKGNPHLKPQYSAFRQIL
jgi:hypothetical protein